MKSKYGKLLISTIFLIMIMALPSILFAQASGDPGPDPDAPIDGGLGVLIVAGIGYGAKKVRDNRKKKLNQPEAI